MSFDLVDYIKNWEDKDVIDLSSRGISSLPPGLFDQCVRVKSLHLSRNKLRKLPLGIFDKCVQLEYLYLHGNQIEELPLGIFNQCVNLKYLFLNQNRIRELSPNIFDRIHLEVLGISENPVEETATSVFGKEREIKLRRCV